VLTDKTQTWLTKTKKSCSLCSVVLSQSYPTKPTKIIIFFSWIAGFGAVDRQDTDMAHQEKTYALCSVALSQSYPSKTTLYYFSLAGSVLSLQQNKHATKKKNDIV
jgi:hypothetical protein